MISKCVTTKSCAFCGCGLGPTRSFPAEGLASNPLLLELLFWSVMIALALVLVWRRPRILAQAELAFRKVARHRTLSILMVLGLALGIRAALLPCPRQTYTSPPARTRYDSKVRFNPSAKLTFGLQGKRVSRIKSFLPAQFFRTPVPSTE